jgi:hypothetical protein
MYVYKICVGTSQSLHSKLTLRHVTGASTHDPERQGSLWRWHVGQRVPQSVVRFLLLVCSVLQRAGLKLGFLEGHSHGHGHGQSHFHAIKVTVMMMVTVMVTTHEFQGAVHKSGVNIVYSVL